MQLIVEQALKFHKQNNNLSYQHSTGIGIFKLVSTVFLIYKPSYVMFQDNNTAL